MRYKYNARPTLAIVTDSEKWSGVVFNLDAQAKSRLQFGKLVKLFIRIIVYAIPSF